ncbi:peptidylprolyl isomerase [Roseateles paludis]|uniref:peptidylprolyl isomerase n=1 Tax=Roseateles paludis TaxID=3145238 RepID=UPI003D3316EC
MLALLTACGGGGGGSSTPTTPTPTTPTPVTLTVTHKVRITTSLGDIDLGLDRNHAPITVDNFLKYVNDGFYKSTVFHRVIKDFVIQGGGYARGANGLVEKAATYPAIALESQNGLSNLRGTLAMARTAVPNSATSQFYINTVDNTSLNYPSSDGYGYAVFGQVTAGLDVVDKIRAVATANDVPVSDVTILDAKVIP